jgi:hypothetical protein
VFCVVWARYVVAAFCSIVGACAGGPGGAGSTGGAVVEVVVDVVDVVADVVEVGVAG